MSDQTTDPAPAERPRQVTFVEPMPGFADDLSFTLSRIDDAGLLQSLRSVRDPGLRFVITPAGAFFADYRDSVSAALAGPLGALLGSGPAGESSSGPGSGFSGDVGGDSPAGRVELFLMLTIGDGLTDTTANLRAPLVLEPDSGRAVQVILDDETLAMRHPLVAR